ncbi:response regulator [Oxalobacteraceae bacterium CAVE-383]|nr:response regulator [Oxalobacteraceae bacterium CAVE-383]
MSNNAFAGDIPEDNGSVPSYNRSLLNAVGLALSFAVLAISAALAWDQMSLVIDNIQRRDYVEQLDILKNNQRKLVYSLDQTARLHSRLLVEQHRSDICEADIVFPGELNIPPEDRAGNPNTDLHITTTLGDTGCASRFRLLRRLSRSLAISIHSFWNDDAISNYTFDLKGRFLAQSHRFADVVAAGEGMRREQIAIATAPLEAVLQRMKKTAGPPALPFFTGLHRRNADREEVLSIGVPIYNKEKLLAITALDIEQRAFNRVFMQGGRLPGFFVFDTSRSSPALLNNIADSEYPLAQSIVKHWNAINMVTRDMTATKIGHRFYLAETIPGTPWVAVYSFSFGDIFLASESLWMWIGFSMFGALLLLWIGIHLINRHMLVPLNMASQRIAASENLNRTIIATAPVGLCMLDLQTMQVLLTNDLARSYAARWGQRPGLALSILQAHAAIAGAASRSERPVTYTELPTPEDIDAPPLLAAFSQVTYREREILLCGLSDITRQKEAEAMLRRARHSADEANIAKSMFLATISHEIRTPLHGAMGNLELLENTPLSPSQHSTIDTINRAFFSLLQIVNNVLDLSKAGADQLRLSGEAVDPIALLEEVARTFAPCIVKKQLEFFCLLDNRLPKRLIGDETRLRQIFNNLLSNAVKFTGSGKIVMRADFKEIAAGVCRFAVQVIDSGIGISEHDQKKLFSPFQQANKTIAGNFGGTGLGLSLIKNLCEAMGGTIKVDSREHQGASFTVGLGLPVAQAEAGVQWPALDGLVIALRCDDHAWRKQLQQQLESAGACILPAARNDAASKDAAPLPISCDTFLLACQDSQIAGYLPDLANYPDARHVIVTPLGPLPPEREGACIRVSALSQRELLSAVDPGFEPVPMRSRADTEKIASCPDIAPAAPADTASLNILLVEDDLTNVALAQQQLAMLGYNNIDLAKNGLDALDKCNEKIYQLILTDQFMPGMDGNLLAAALREKSYPVKIVMITASRPSPEDRRNLDAVLIKPASLGQLRSVLDSHCTQSTDMERPATPPSQTILWNAFLQDYENTFDTLEAAARNGERAKCLEQLHKLRGALEILRQPLAKEVAILERRSKTIPLNKLTGAYRVLRQTLDCLVADRQDQ